MVLSRFLGASSSVRTTTTRTAALLFRRCLSSSTTNSTILYLHVGPSGDCWTGPSIYAAKHLQPDYVKSIPLPSQVGNNIESLLERLEDDVTIAQQIYDTAKIPDELIDDIKKGDAATTV
mmetsp:Transcript_14261/g.23614  ORF Transcript_14261/g.23614 Transcript_14261/m.23614 type:complete len:120 (+) Transcript_14261:139-498(+)|eukprot:CAMPEP_0119018594 /NCGR_PEP_ID=MMETSP1176-20130426/19824_1 /TAXON_ID=265551 /ORGANISM="Synedropsis recta cf, Strain CCMP1620" /LENGTH=119 /DNA_ID=CAMNT_0006972625 /DNA_START=49 /DNA_END=408 /DNA_ORIENTATION=-